MKKLFISADIEGTCGITHWDETEKGHADHAWFADQLTREVAAACRGALSAGYDYVLVKDAHDSGRNIDPRGLPRGCELIRGWGQDPMGMMLGLTDDFSGAVMIGYHDAAGKATNPLAHTWSTSLHQVLLNGELFSELYLNSLIAARLAVPVFAVSGDQGICDWMGQKGLGTVTIAVNQGTGGAVRGLHPDQAVERIEQEVKRAVMMPPRDCLFPMPDHYVLDISYRKHEAARKGSFYRGMEQTGERSLRFSHDDFYEVLRMMQFCM